MNADQQAILIVEDDATSRTLMHSALAKRGYRVLDAADGAAAVALMRESPSLALLDLRLPDTTGLELMHRLRTEPNGARIPMVLCSGFVSLADTTRFAAAGFDDVLMKPIDPSRLVQVVHAHLAEEREEPLPTDDHDDDSRAPSLDVLVSQLEKQIAVNVELRQRCASLSAELSIISGISGALTSGLQIDDVLDAALSACIDVGGIEQGALFVLTGDRSVDTRVIGIGDDAAIRALQGRREQILKVAARGSTVVLSGAAQSLPPEFELPAAVTQRYGVFVPLVHEEHVGLLLILSKDAAAKQDRIIFAEGVANQVAIALGLARSFAKQAETERRANENASMLRSILASITDSVISVDRQGKITHASNAVEMLGTGLPPENWAAQRSFYQGDGSMPLVETELPLTNALNGKHVRRAEMFVQHASQNEGKWYSVSARPLCTNEGEAYGAVEVAREITSEKNVQSQLMMSDRLASLGMIAAGVAHEINNPLAAVMLNLESAARDAQAFLAHEPGVNLAEVGAALHDARQAAEQVRGIVRDLRIFSRKEEDKPGAVDVRAVLEFTVRMAWNEIRHRARLVEDYGTIPFVDANESRLGQVFLNLVMNAAQAIPPGGADANEIRIRTAVAPNNRVLITVEDTGSGIPPEILNRLFTPFVTSKPRGAGTGLGLAMCYRIIKSLRGDIEVESTVGHGTTFRILLPASEAVVSDAPAPQVSTQATRRGHILVIDDEQAVGLGVKRMLSAEHDVVAIQDAREGLNRIMNGERFDVILCDLMMPVCTGMEFYRTLMALYPKLAQSIIFLSGGTFAPYGREFLEKIPNLRLEKPFDGDVLRSVVNERVR